MADLTEISSLEEKRMSDRHDKWVPVSPGTVIPAGQPYRVEYDPSWSTKATAVEMLGNDVDWKISEIDSKTFVDSSWKPPLVLPTEPTWGVLVFKDYDHTGDTTVVEHILDEWSRRGPGSIGGAGTATMCEVQNVLDFIPLTDEQIQRIEAAQS